MGHYGGVPRFSRYLLIWVTCTAASVTAVLATVGFVTLSTRPRPPVAESATAAGAPESSLQSARPSPPVSPTPTTAPRKTTGSGRPAASSPRAAATSSPSPQPPVPVTDSIEVCLRKGRGPQTVPSEGGKATVRYGNGRVCLVSATPNPGFKVDVAYTNAQTLVATFTSSSHCSQITATTNPTARASVRETSP